MTKSELIERLNADLANEHKHMMTYLHFAATVIGPHREEFREMWLEAAKSELQHCNEFANVIVGLGGSPTAKVAEFPTGLLTPRDQVAYALAMEDEVVANYVARLGHAEELGGVDGTFVGLFLEDQIVDSRTDADNFRQMLRGM